MKVSITLPSLHEDLLKKCLLHLRATTVGLDCEIVVASPFPVTEPHVVWVEDREIAGNCAAHTLAYEHSTGDIVVAMSDDMLPQSGWLAAALAQLVHSERRHRGTCIGVHQVPEQLGTVFGIYYPFFPLTFRSTIEAAGGYYSREFVAHFGDADLGLRIWRAGGRCEPCFDAKFMPTGAREYFSESKDRSRRFLSDMETFIAKWKDSYGRGWTSEHPRDFNLNIYEPAFAPVLRDGTIFYNDPEFGRRIRAYYEDYKVDYRRYP